MIDSTHLLKNGHVILATDRNFVYRRNNGLPWDIKEELKWFSEITQHNFYNNKKNVLLMGKETYLSIGRPLPNRVLAVISSTLTKEEMRVGELLFRSFEEFLDYSNTNPDTHIFFIGGANIWRFGIEHCGEIYHTVISEDVKDSTEYEKLPIDICSTLEYLRDEATVTSVKFLQSKPIITKGFDILQITYNQ